MIPSDQREVLRFPIAADGFLRVGGSRVDTSHILRYTGQYVWCAACGAYCSGKEARLIGKACTKTVGPRKYVLGRLARGEPPQPSAVALLPGCGEGQIRLDGNSAVQVPE